MAPSGPVLIAYDDSPSAREAVPAAHALLGDRPAVVVTVWEPAVALGPSSFPAGVELTTPELGLQVDEAARERAEGIAQQGAEAASAVGFQATAATRESPSVWRGVLDAADEHDASAIVLGARGLSAVRSVLLGSVTHGVLHHAARPVLVLPARGS